MKVRCDFFLDGLRSSLYTECYRFHLMVESRRFRAFCLSCPFSFVGRDTLFVMAGARYSKLL